VNVLLLQLDGKLPNVALMRIAAHHRALGDSIELRHAATVRAVQPELYDRHDRIYASLIFERTRPVAEALKIARPDAVVGGTGWDLVTTLEGIGITTTAQDYTLYPRYQASIGFLQRGCRLKCSFCIVPKLEGAVRHEQTVADLWRGDPWPRHLVVLDNDFFGNPAWRQRIAEIQEGGFRINFNQGINARFLDEETAAAIASVPFYDENMKQRRIYTAWDNKKDEKRLFAGLNHLVAAGIRPAQIMVYILVGYWPGETHEDRDERRRKLREFGADPYPMPYARTPECVAFQRWVIGHYDKKIPWAAWWKAKGEPRKLGPIRTSQLDLLAPEDS
jgi:hypothetical protein